MGTIEYYKGPQPTPTEVTYKYTMQYTHEWLKEETFEQRQEKLRLKKYTKQLKKHKATCQKNRLKRKKKK